MFFYVIGYDVAFLRIDGALYVVQAVCERVSHDVELHFSAQGVDVLGEIYEAATLRYRVEVVPLYVVREPPIFR